MEEKQESSVSMKPIQDWGCHCGRRTELLWCGTSCSSQRWWCMRTPLTLHWVFVLESGAPHGAIRTFFHQAIIPSGPRWKIKQSGYLRPNLNSLHGLQVAGKRRGVQNVISIAFLSLCHTCRMWGVLNKCFAGK